MCVYCVSVCVCRVVHVCVCACVVVCVYAYVCECRMFTRKSSHSEHSGTVVTGQSVRKGGQAGRKQKLDSTVTLWFICP